MSEVSIVGGGDGYITVPNYGGAPLDLVDEKNYDLYTIPNCISDRLFSYTKLSSIILPVSVTSIEHNAFESCRDLTSVTIPNSVTSIEGYSFWNCTNLTTIISEIQNPFAISDFAFDIGSDKDIYATATLIVPPGKKSAYQNTAGWNKFTNIVEAGQGGIIGCEFEDKGIRYLIRGDNTVSVVSREVKYSGDVILPGSVEFNGNTYIVTVIADDAFSGCSGLTSITLPPSIRKIGEFAFDGCYLNSVHISDLEAWCHIIFYEETHGLRSSNPMVSAQHLFLNGVEIKDLIIPNSVTNIGYATFQCCSKLTSITIPNSVTSIGEIAFSFCSGLNTLTLPNSVTSIGRQAFAGCSSLTTIVSEIANPFAIDDGFDKDIYATATLYVPSGKKTAYQNTVGWNKFQNIVEIVGLGDEFEHYGIRYKIGENNTVSVVSKDTYYSGDISIPTSVSYQKKSYKVTSIGNSAFEGCVDLTTIYLPNSLTRIGNGAFWQCSSLKLVVIPDGVTTIGEGAFHNCFNLVSVVIPNSVTSIGSSAFSNCSNLSQVISRIQNPFAINSNVFTTYSTTTLFIPKGTKSAYSAKSGWKKFTNIDDGTIADPTKRTIHVAAAGTLSYFIPDDEKYMVEELTLSGELNGTDIRYIRDLSGTNYIYYHENNCITFCDEYYDVSTSGKLTVLDITNTKIVSGGDIYYAHTISFDDEIHDFYFTNDNSITNHMFYGCKLEVIKLPDSVTSIEGGAFCYSLSSVTIPNSVTSIGSGAFGNTKWYDNHSNGLLYLDQWLIGYKGTAPAGELRIVDGTKGIADGALYWCSGLTSITIPSSVTSIGKYAFSGCSGLTSIISLNSTPPTCQQNSDGSFSQFDSVDKTNCIVWVPRESANAYKEANGWKDFQNIRALILGDVNIDFEANKDDLDALVAYIMDKAPEGFDKDLADLNGDDKVNAADVVKLVTILNIQDGLSTDWQQMFNSSQVITSLACTLNNNWDKAIQVTKCELYYNQSLVGYATFNVTLASGESKKCSFDSLADYSAKKGFFVVWHCSYNGDSYTYCFDLPE